VNLPEFSPESKAPDENRDKPLGFYWKAPTDWLADLDLKKRVDQVLTRHKEQRTQAEAWS